jgi:hypothetical protein
MKHDFDWSTAPAPWNHIGAEAAAVLRRVASQNYHYTPKPLKVGPLPCKGQPVPSDAVRDYRTPRGS